jgi:hypothetical protein
LFFINFVRFHANVNHGNFLRWVWGSSPASPLNMILCV